MRATMATGMKGKGDGRRTTGQGSKGLVRCVGGEGAGNPSDVVILGDQEIMGNLGGSTGVGRSGALLGALQ